MQQTDTFFPPSINLAGRLVTFGEPQVMGILNVTSDSFFAASRVSGAEAVVARARQILDEGGTMVDVGACSTRPGSTPVDEDEEWRRLDGALAALRRELPEAIVSVDTFRADVARRCVQEYGVQIINDISGGERDPQMFETVAELGVPYVLTHDGSLSPTPSAADEAWLASVARYLAERLQRLYDLGVADVILDPGFGFGKTLEQNYLLLRRLGDFIRLFPSCPFLVGVSRKRMVWQLLGITPDEALNGTTVLHTVALQAGAHLLRVHDVRAAVEAIKTIEAIDAIDAIDAIEAINRKS
ncbi:MAG: dihydropteroate synthase [Bacteroidaceae bacterium]|nr:dihydropteroate synthase [Bacteroidaceae bacterium]